MTGTLIGSAAIVGIGWLASRLQPALVGSQRIGPGTAGVGLRPEVTTSSRRRFLRWVTVGTLAVATAEAGLAVSRFLWSNRREAFGQPVVAATRASLPAIDGPPLKHSAGHFYLIQNPDGLLALHWRCTHLGCTVPWRDDEGQFHCNCHNSLFNRRGEVIGGPASRPLDRMPITLVGEQVIVDTGTIITRERHSPTEVTAL